MNTVLIVEDDPGNMQAFCSLMCVHHFLVVEATNGQEALHASTRCYGPIALALCDLELPDMSGTEVAMKILKSHPETRILFISGTPVESWSDVDVRNLRRLPPESVDFLEKPFRPAALEAKIEHCLNREPKWMY